MPKVSDYELSHSEEEVSFQKIRRKKNGNQSSKKTKGKREKKIDF